MLVIGIDPGLDGGVAVLHEQEGKTGAAVAVMPTRPGPNGRRQVNAGALYAWLRSFSEGRAHPPDLVVFEQVHSKPTDGSTSAFTFGKATGKALAVFEVLGWPLEEVTPQAWKAVILAGTDKSKQAAIGWATSRFPGVSLVPTARSKKPHDGLAEALCLAELGRRLRGVRS
jgi:hypothetical protein